MSEIFRISHINQTHSRRQWAQETQLLFFLSGSAQIYTEQGTQQLQSEDVFLINMYDIYQITGAEWNAVGISFRPDRLNAPRTGSGQSARFDLSSSGNTYSTVYDFIRYCIAQLVCMDVRKEPYFSSRSIFYALYSHLITNFSAPPAVIPMHNQTSQERLISILDYIDDHYAESLTLNETADVFGLSSPYLSSFFKKQTGKSFMDYYNEVRLSHAVEELLAGTESIENIALGSGFRDPRAFTSLFRKKYGVLPNVFRRDHSHSEALEQSADNQMGQTPDPASFPILEKYLAVFREETDFARSFQENPRIIDAGSVSVLAPGKRLTHNYHTMICVGNAKQFLYAEIQDMLRRVQKEIHFRYAKFHGLLSDDLMVYSEDAHGIAHYSFTMMDKVIDFMLSIDLRPLCQLSFMPIALAEDPARLVDFYHYNTSPPKDMRKWVRLVEAVTEHLISRYGLEEVRTWPFCVWNEPDETVDQFSWSDRERFFDFYCQTWRAVKGVCPEISFGTPSLLLSVQQEYGWAAEFFFYVRSRGCEPDFLNIHYYDNSLFEEDAADRIRGEKGYSAENMERSFPLTADPYAFVKFINNVKELMRRYGMGGIPIYLTEWNLTISHRDLINDTCFKSCHLIKNLLENYDRLSSYSYWCLTDFEEELQVPAQLYHGGLGLFTYTGIPKANYNAFRLLGRLGDDLLDRGNGYFITKNKRGVAILLYNYEHYSRLFAAGFRSNQIHRDRYTAFEELTTAHFTIRLTDLTQTCVLVKERFVNQAAGSSYDTWARMGSRPVESAEDLEILVQQSVPGLYLHQEKVENGSLILHVRMAPLEIRLIEVE